MSRTAARSVPGTAEFVPLVALLVSLGALATDAMLPALPEIGRDLGAPHPNDVQVVVTSLFLGLGLGQVLFGPLSDRIGRKPAIHAGLALFMLGSVVCVLATTFEAMIAGRILQGIGGAGPRTVTLALLRDRYEGRQMARLMSFAMAVTVMVPAVAPALGQGILWLGGWRGIFVTFLVAAAIAFAWFAVRQPETLPADRRRAISPRAVGRAVGEILRSRAALGYASATGFVFAPFIAYLSSAQQIFQDVYGVGALFPIYFGVLALAFGAAALANGRLVMKHGMRRLCKAAMASAFAISAVAFAGAWAFSGVPPLWLLMVYFAATFMCVGVVIGNLNALAMQPLGHIAGIGAAFVAALTTAISVPLGALVGQRFDGTMYAQIGALAVFSAATFAAMKWAESGTGREAADR